MVNLTANKKSNQSKSKKSRFEKLWDKANRLKRQNELLKTRLEELIASADQRIRPVEREAAEADLPLLKKLLILGQRKSLAKWERGVLDEWIRELITDMQTFDISDSNLMDDMARYDAFRLGIELDEEDTDSPYEQVSSYMQNLQRETEAAAEKQRVQEQEDVEEELDSLKKYTEELIEKILDKRLGPPPAVPEKHAHTFDLLQNELDAELENQQQAYQIKRDELREQLLAEMQEDTGTDAGAPPFDNDWDDVDPFANPDFDYESEFRYSDRASDRASGTEPAAPKIDNQTFHRMFRATAAKLHPDREPDPDIRLEKQTLMAELLKARKKGDLLTVFQMYHQHTDNPESFSKADEKQLIAAITHHIEQLEEEQEEIVFQSPMHFSTYQRFYHSNKRKQNKAIDDHISEVRKNIRASAKMFGSITTLKSLKPWLEIRYDNSEADIMDELMSEIMDGINMDTDVRDYPF